MTQPAEAPEKTPEDLIAEGERLQAELAENLARRVEACTQEMTAVLDKYGLKLHMTAPQLTLLPK